MMTSVEFIKTRVKDFLDVFTEVRVRYCYSEEEGVHFIEFVPDYIRNHDVFCEFESKMIEDFCERYPAEGICFVSEDSAVSIKEAQWILYGSRYAITSSGNSIQQTQFRETLTELSTPFFLNFVSVPVIEGGLRFDNDEVLIESSNNEYLLAA